MELKEIREQLDKIDDAMLLLIKERVSLIPKVANYKLEHNLQRYQPDREEELLSKKRLKAKELELNPDFVEDIYKRLIEESHRIEKEIMKK